MADAKIMLEDGGGLALRCKACYAEFPINVDDRDSTFLAHVYKDNEYPHPTQADLDAWTDVSVPSIPIETLLSNPIDTPTSEAYHPCYMRSDA